VESEDEETWRHRIEHLRTLLRFATGSPVEAALRQLIAEAEQRLAALQEQQETPRAPPAAEQNGEAS
jgi:hypothetical protein